MGLILFGLGAVLIVEGLAYALAPSLIEDLLRAMKDLPLDTRRLIGLTALCLGVALVWAAVVLGGAAL